MDVPQQPSDEAHIRMFRDASDEVDALEIRREMDEYGRWTRLDRYILVPVELAS